MHQWFHSRYGDRLKVDFSPGSIVVMLAGGHWRLRLPLILCPARIVCVTPNRAHVSDQRGQVFDALSYIEGLPESALPRLTDVEMRTVLNLFVDGLQAFLSLLDVQREPLVEEALENMAQAVSALFANTPRCGVSKWASLEAVEKALKSFLINAGDEPEHNHKLKEHARCAQAKGLEGFPDSVLTKLQCGAGVKYGDPVVTLMEAVEAHHAALSALRVIGPQIKRRMRHA